MLLAAVAVFEPVNVYGMKIFQGEPRQVSRIGTQHIVQQKSVAPAKEEQRIVAAVEFIPQVKGRAQPTEPSPSGVGVHDGSPILGLCDQTCVQRDHIIFQKRKVGVGFESAAARAEAEADEQGGTEFPIWAWGNRLGCGLHIVECCE